MKKERESSFLESLAIFSPFAVWFFGSVFQNSDLLLFFMIAIMSFSALFLSKAKKTGTALGVLLIYSCFNLFLRFLELDPNRTPELSVEEAVNMSMSIVVLAATWNLMKKDLENKNNK